MVSRNRRRKMPDLTFFFLLLYLVALLYAVYQGGYWRGRTDGFNEGWNTLDAMRKGELP